MAKISINLRKSLLSRNISREVAFSRFVSPVIDKVLGLRCTSFGYQSARLWGLCQVCKIQRQVQQVNVRDL